MTKSVKFHSICAKANTVSTRSMDAAKADALAKINELSGDDDKTTAKLAKAVARYCVANKATSVAANVRYVYTMLGLDDEGRAIWEKMTGLKHTDAVLHTICSKENLKRLYEGLEIGKVWRTAFTFTYYKWEVKKGKEVSTHIGCPKDIESKSSEWKEQHKFSETVSAKKVDETKSNLWTEQFLTGEVQTKKPILEWEMLTYIRKNLGDFGFTCNDFSESLKGREKYFGNLKK